ncbi:MAG: VIT1/CCC1 transporter family protein [Bacteroidota bacterium]
MHYEKHLMNSAFISDLVIGMSDGLTVPFALAAGLSSAVHSNALIITAGAAEIIAGSIAMGLGGFLAGQTEVEHYDSELKKEYWEIDEYPEVEIKEVKDIFEGMGLSVNTQELAVQEMIKDKDNWVNFMMKYELGLEKPDKDRARKSAFNIGFAYIAGGTIPLLSYVFTSTPDAGFKLSFLVTVVCLLLFGYYKSKVTGQNPVWGALKVTLIGVVAALAAYFLVKAFS